MMIFATGSVRASRLFLRRFLLGLAAALTLSGCASTPKSYEIRGEAAPIINRDIGGKPLSVVVRLYQLKDNGEFSKLTFDTLANGRPESDLLGQDLLEKSEVIVVPGGKYTGKDAIREETRFIGLVAFFREPDQHYWRYVVDAEKARDEGLVFRIEDCYLALVKPKPKELPGQPIDGKPICSQPNSRQSGTTATGNAAPLTSSQKRSGSFAKNGATDQTSISRP